MKKITKVVPVFKQIQIQDGTKEVVSYLAVDGTEFTEVTAEQDCLAYEDLLMQQSSITKLVVNYTLFLDIFNIWWFANNEDELEIIKNYVYFYDKNNMVHINGKLYIPNPNNRMMEDRLDITYPGLFQNSLMLNIWKNIFCPAGWHLFDELQSMDDHYLSCDACDLAIHISKNNTGLYAEGE